MKLQITNYPDSAGIEDSRLQSNRSKSQIISRGVLFLIIVLIFGNWSLSEAQTAPEFIISWRAMNYVPSGYQGKALPINSTPIEIGLDIVESGKIVSLTANEIRWFFNGDLLRSGNGLKTIRLNSKSASQQIRVVVANYKGVNLEKIFIIPAQTPKLVIDTRLPNSNAGLGKYRLEALPYFFNIFSLQELKFDWSANNQPVSGETGDPQILDVDFSSESAPAETNIRISAIVSNRFNPVELSSGAVELNVR
ncbi:MAG: hypothetical protein Q8P76_02530 [bacterium]|nr:hypothetical protein [bacterium]